MSNYKFLIFPSPKRPNPLVNDNKKLGQRGAFCVATDILVDSGAMADESLGGMVFDAEKITKRRLRKSKIEYLVKWKGRDGKELLIL